MYVKYWWDACIHPKMWHMSSVHTLRAVKKMITHHLDALFFHSSVATHPNAHAENTSTHTIVKNFVIEAKQKRASNDSKGGKNEEKTMATSRVLNYPYPVSTEWEEWGTETACIEWVIALLQHVKMTLGCLLGNCTRAAQYTCASVWCTRWAHISSEPGVLQMKL